MILVNDMHIERVYDGEFLRSSVSIISRTFNAQNFQIERCMWVEFEDLLMWSFVGVVVSSAVSRVLPVSTQQAWCCHCSFGMSCLSLSVYVSVSLLM